MQEWFKARNVWAGAFEALTDAEAGRLAKALWKYTTTREQVELSGNERGCFAMIVYTLQMDEKEANALSATRKEAGAKGGKQKVANLANATIKNKNREEEDIKENDLTVIKEKRPRFSPPTADEVRQYCRERQNKVDPQRFVDFYAAKGWKVGNTPMKDWKAAVRTWEQREGNITPMKQVTAQQYAQRDYTEDELEARITQL